MEANEPFRPGLEDVVVAETALSLVDGEGGRLVVRGHADRGARRRCASRRCAACSGTARCPTPARAEAIRRGLGEGRVAAPSRSSRAAARALEARRRHGGAARAGLASLRARGRAARAHGLPAGRRDRGGRSPPGTGGRRGARPLAPDPDARPRRRPAAHAARRAGARRAGARPRHLPGDGGRARHERLDLHRARRGLHALRCGLGASWRRSARSRARCTAARPGPVLDMLDAIGQRRARRRPGCARSSPRAAASWASATASTACAIRARPCSRRRSPSSSARGVASRYLAPRARGRARGGARRSTRTAPSAGSATNVEFYTAVLLDVLGHSARAVHAGLRGGPQRGLARARGRGARRRPPDPPAPALRGAAAGGVRRGARAAGGGLSGGRQRELARSAPPCS